MDPTMLAALASVGMQGAQLAATKAQGGGNYAHTRLNELRGKAGKGQLGRDQARDQRIIGQHVRPAKQVGTQMQSKGEGVLGALGRTRAGDVARLGRETGEMIQGAQERGLDQAQEAEAKAEETERGELMGLEAKFQAEQNALIGNAMRDMSGITGAMGEEAGMRQAAQALDQARGGGGPTPEARVAVADYAEQYGVAPEVASYAQNLIGQQGLEGAVSTARATRHYMDTGEQIGTVDMQLAQLMGYDPRARAQGALGTPTLTPGSPGFDPLEDVDWDALAL